jgi:peroxin-1
LGTGQDSGSTSSECVKKACPMAPCYVVHTLLAAGLDPPSKKNALLLSTNTEVSIAPKLHSNKQISSNSPANGHTPTVKSLAANDTSTAPTIPSKDGSCLLRVLPARLLPNIRFLHCSDFDSLAYISRVTFAQLHTSKSTADSFYCGQFRPLSSPADSTATPPPPPQNPDPVLVRLSSSSGSEGGKVVSSKSGKLWIGTSEGLPAGHVVFFVLPEGVDEWGLVKYAASHI